MLQSSQEHPDIRVETPFLPNREAIEVKIYDSNALQAEMVTNSRFSIMVLAEKSSSGTWMLSFWRTSASDQQQISVDRQSFTNFCKEYTLLFSTCVKVLFQLYKDPELFSKLRVFSCDDWISDNFLKEWNRDISDRVIRVEIVSRTDGEGSIKPASTKSKGFSTFYPYLRKASLRLS